MIREGFHLGYRFAPEHIGILGSRLIPVLVLIVHVTVQRLELRATSELKVLQRASKRP